MPNYTKLFTACFLLLGFGLNAHTQTQRAVADKIVAIIGDHTILQSDIDNTIEDMRRQGEKIPADAKCLLMRQAIASKILMQQALKDSLPVTDEDVEAELRQRLNSFAASGYSEKEISLENIPESTRPYLKERMLADAMQNKILQNVRITPSEVKAFYDKIPRENLPSIETQYELCQVVVYPKPAAEAEQYLINEMNRYKSQVESKTISFMDLISKADNLNTGLELELDRNDKKWDPDFLAAAFRLKEGEISPPVKSKFGYHLILMKRRNGDDAVVLHFFKMVPVSYEDVKVSVDMLYQLRDEMMKKNIAFKDAASNFNEDKDNESTGYCITAPDGSSRITIDQLDKPLAQAVSNLKPRELSKPVVSEDPGGRKSVHLLYLQSRTESHIMNLKDDYSQISSLAMEQKKQKTIEKWIDSVIGNYDIMIDDAAANECPVLKKLSNR